MMDESTLQDDAREACRRCHQEHHSDQLKPLWRVPRYVVACKLGSDVRNEVYEHYCPRCRRTMNTSVAVLGVIIVLGLLGVILLRFP